MNDDSLICFGGTVKALGDGRVGGYLVLFSGPDDPDLQGDYFTKSTDFKTRTGREMDILYRHGVHPVIKSRTLGSAEVEIDEIGVFLHGELALRDKYEQAIYKLAEMGKLGWSSGALGHLVQRRPKNKAFEVETWALGEASLTPTPVEPRTSAFPLKSLAEVDIDEVDALIQEDEEPPVLSLAGLPALKALCEALSPAVTITRLEHSEIADAAVKELLTHNKVFVDAFRHYRVRLDQHVEFRKERNRKPMSDAQSESIKSWKDGLSDVRHGIESLENDLDGTLRLSDNARAQANAAALRAKFLMQQVNDLTSIIAKE